MSELKDAKIPCGAAFGGEKLKDSLRVWLRW
jgi:hypothetical protein